MEIWILQRLLSFLYFFDEVQKKTLIIDLPNVVNFPGNFYQSDVKSVLELLILSLLPTIFIIMFLLTTNVEIMIWLTNNRTPDNFFFFLRIYVLQHLLLSINEHCINVWNYWFYFIYFYCICVPFFHCRKLTIFT